VLSGGGGVAPRSITDEHAALGRRFDVSIGRTSARDDGKFQVGRTFKNFLCQGSMISHVDGRPLQTSYNFVLRAGCFRHFTDFAERYARPRRLIYAELKCGLYFGAN